MSLIAHAVGARPNFVKSAPLMAALDRVGFSQLLVHTGQHYDHQMSQIFFEQLGLRPPDVNLRVGPGSHATQTAEIMLRFEPVLLQYKPEILVVYGDVNSTLACALVAAKIGIPVAHVEAGLRCNDLTMPEEINRILTDRLSDLLFTPSKDAWENLLREGVAAEKMYFVGNVMIDTLVHLLPEAERRWEQVRLDYGLEDQQYGLVTVHRPSNVDDSRFGELLGTLEEVGRDVPLLFPVHPRTRARWPLRAGRRLTGVTMIEPLGYIENLAVQRHAAFVITDSGGMQEESTYLGVPCFTMREHTERPVTVEVGTNVVCGTDHQLLKRGVAKVLAGRGKRGMAPTLWDGRTSGRIVSAIQQYLAAKSTVLSAVV